MDRLWTGLDPLGVSLALAKPGLATERAFNIKEWGSLHVRAEAFNLTNTANFAQSVNDLSAGAAFGVISSTVSNPRIIQFALKYKF